MVPVIANPTVEGSTAHMPALYTSILTFISLFAIAASSRESCNMAILGTVGVATGTGRDAGSDVVALGNKVCSKAIKQQEASLNGRNRTTENTESFIKYTIPTST